LPDTSAGQEARRDLRSHPPSDRRGGRSAVDGHHHGTQRSEWLADAIEKYKGRKGKGEWAAQIRQCESKLADIKKKNQPSSGCSGMGWERKPAENSYRGSLGSGRRSPARWKSPSGLRLRLPMTMPCWRPLSVSGPPATLLTAKDFQTREIVIRAVTPRMAVFSPCTRTGRWICTESSVVTGTHLM